jgi:uncharacterized protein
MDSERITQRTIPAEQVEDLQRAFLIKVYGWMTAGLMVTGIVSLFTFSSPGLLELIFSSRWVYLGLLFGQLGLVIFLSARIERMSAATATTVFIAYSALTGLTLTVIFLAYTAESLATTFFVTAGTFGLMSAYGYFTRRDLTGFGGFLMMGLIGLVLASIVNIFFNNSTLYWITTYIGIFIFVGLTAYDTQKIRLMSAQGFSGEEGEQKGAIMGALRLYLDFINLFLLLLRLTGNNR